MAALKGVGSTSIAKGGFNPISWTGFSRTAWTQPEGSIPAFIHEARIFGVNLVNWTVNVSTVFDRKLFHDVQVASPYMNPTAGEGIYVVPEVGSKCYLCIPSDGPPPFVMAFMMPMETIPDAATAEAPAGTVSSGGDSTNRAPRDFTFAGGRAKGKPGDMVWRGRDGNFMILHRGGIAQFGCSSLAQRICIPLGNLITDISQNYKHYNSGGSVKWGVQDLGEDNPETEYRQTVRVYANDAFADIRFAMGKVRAPVDEPVGDAGETIGNTQLDIGISNPIVFEMVLAPGGFESEEGEQNDATPKTKLRFIFDRAGNAMARFEGNVNLRFKKKLRMVIDDDVTIIARKNVSLTCDGALSLIGKKSASIGTEGGSLALNSGTKPIATVGSTVRVPILPGIIPVISATGAPIGFVGPGILDATVMSGNPTLLG